MEPDRGSVERMATPEAAEEARRVANRYYEELLNDARLLSRDGIATVADVVRASHLARIEHSAAHLDDSESRGRSRWAKSSRRAAVYLLVVSGALIVASIVAVFAEGEAFAARFGGLSVVVVALSAVIGVLSALPARLLGRRDHRDFEMIEDLSYETQARGIDGGDSLQFTHRNSIHGAATRGRFLVLWLDLEKALRDMASRKSVGTEGHVANMPNGEVLQRLRQSGLISEVQNQDILNVLSVRNRMVHGKDLSERDLRAATELANRVLEDLN